MSYHIHIFHPDVKEKASRGIDLDSLEHPPLSESVVQDFTERLELYGYKLEHQSDHRKASVKTVGQCLVQVSVSKMGISFSVPYGEGSEDAIFDALQDSAEMCDSGSLVTFNPQDGEWGP